MIDIGCIWSTENILYYSLRVYGWLVLVSAYFIVGPYISLICTFYANKLVALPQALRFLSTRLIEVRLRSLLIRMG